MASPFGVAAGSSPHRHDDVLSEVKTRLPDEVNGFAGGTNSLDDNQTRSDSCPADRNFKGIACIMPGVYLLPGQFAACSALLDEKDALARRRQKRSWPESLSRRTRRRFPDRVCRGDSAAQPSLVPRDPFQSHSRWALR